MKHSQKPTGLGKGQKATISGSPNDMGLNMREAASNKGPPKPRGETSIMKQQPTRPHGSIDSDRGTFPTK